jgi:hypothetical protein
MRGMLAKMKWEKNVFSFLFVFVFHGQKWPSLVLGDRLLPLNYRLLSLETGYKLILDHLIEKIERLQVFVFIEALLILSASAIS